PMHVSTGATFDYPMPDMLSQLDAIVWAPFPAPGIFEVDDFALIPRSSAFGFLEIKRSNYSGADEKLERHIENAVKLTADPIAGFDQQIFPAMGVVCVLENKPSARLQALFDQGRAVAIFDNIDPSKSNATVRAKAVVELVNFLHRLTWRYRSHGVRPEII